MSRLTEYHCGVAVIMDKNKLKDAMQKLANYEDLEEQGMLLKLPLKKGDTIWDNDFGRPCSYYVTGFSFGMMSADEYDCEVYDEVVIHFNGLGSSGMCPVSEIGKTVFLTKEEAEKALEEMEMKDGKID